MKRRFFEPGIGTILCTIVALGATTACAPLGANVPKLGKSSTAAAPQSNPAPQAQAAVSEDQQTSLVDTEKLSELQAVDKVIVPSDEHLVLNARQAIKDGREVSFASGQLASARKMAQNKNQNFQTKLVLVVDIDPAELTNDTDFKAALKEDGRDTSFELSLVTPGLEKKDPVADEIAQRHREKLADHLVNVAFVVDSERPAN